MIVASTGVAMEALSDQPPPKHQPIVATLPVAFGFFCSHSTQETSVSVADAGSTVLRSCSASSRELVDLPSYRSTASAA
jgi:hypothetical protein